MRRPGRAEGNFRRLLLFGLVVGACFWLAPGVAPPPAGAGPAKGPGAPPPAQLPGFGKFRVVRIDADGISPRRLRIEKGVTVIWFNATAGYSSVVFNEGEKLLRATRSPTLFFLAPDGTYVSAAFGPGATASTAFVKPGNYSYFVTGLPVSEGVAFARVVVE